MKVNVGTGGFIFIDIPYLGVKALAPNETPNESNTAPTPKGLYEALMMSRSGSKPVVITGNYNSGAFLIPMVSPVLTKNEGDYFGDGLYVELAGAARFNIKATNKISLHVNEERTYFSYGIN